MRALHTTPLWRWLATTLLTGVFMLLSSTAGLGNPSDASSVTPVQQGKEDCGLSPNPDECYHRRTHPQGSPYDPTSATSLLPPLTTETLGINGPVSGELKYDPDLAWLLGFKYLQIFGESAGIAAKITGGANEFRTNITGGYAFTREHQIKVTYEYLTQNLPFNFASGRVREWVSQQSLGAAYQYVIRGEILHSLELSGYITRARSKDLDPIVFNQQAIANGYSYDVNFRRIAGGRENTVLASANFTPFDDKTTLVLGAGYSNIRYDTRYESNQAAERPAFKAEVTHLLSPQIKATVGTLGSAASIEHSVGLSYLFPHHVEGTIKGQYLTGQPALPNAKSIVIGFSYPAPEKYTLTGFGAMEELRNWIDKPVIYSQRVLAIKDEMVRRYEFRTCNTIPDQAKFWGDSLDPVTTAFSFCFTDTTLQVAYSVTTVKTSEGDAPTDTTDHTADLKLALVSTGPNQATFQSTAGLPATLGPGGPDSRGTYLVTLTATASGRGMAPISITNTFTLTVTGARGPMWDNTDIPDADMGFNYPKSPPEIDLTSKIPDPENPPITFSIENGEGCSAAPSWLEINHCTGNASHWCLMSPNIIPNNVDIHSFCVRIVAKNNEGLTTPKVFTKQVNQILPVWTLPATTPSRAYNNFSLIFLTPYITAGTLGLTFAKGPDFDDAHWLINNTAINSVGLRAPGDSTFAGLRQIPIIAINQTSFVGGVLQLVPVRVINPDYRVEWASQAIPLYFKPDAVSDTYTIEDLNQYTPKLVKTFDGLNPIDTDTYSFTVDSATQGTWDTLALPGNPDVRTKLVGTGLEEGEIKIRLKAHSVAADKNAINSNLGPTSEIQELTLLVQGNPRWTGAKDLPGTKLGATTYPPVDLNNLPSPLGALAITPGVPNDKYNFTIVDGSPSCGSWAIETNGSNISQLVNTQPIPASCPDNSKITLILTAKNTAGKDVLNGDRAPDHPEQQQLIIPLLSPPQFIPGATGSIKFDHTGDNNIDPALGLPENPSTDLTNMLSNAPAFTDLEFRFVVDNPSSKWQIRTGSHYLLRKLTLGSPNTVDASDVNSTVSIPSIEVCGTLVSDGTTRLCSQSKPETDVNAIKVTVGSDPNIAYLFGSPDPSALKLVSATSDGNGGRATLPAGTQPSFTAPSNRDAMDRYLLPNKVTRVVNDSNTFFVKPASSPEYITYTNPDTGDLALLAPKATEYTSLVNTPAPGVNTYLNAKSRANGDTAVSGNLENLPPITAGKLILVPYKGAVNSGFDQTNEGNNVGVGITDPRLQCNIITNHAVVTVLAFKLPKPPVGKKYVLTKFAPDVNGGSLTSGLCVNRAGGALPSLGPYYGANLDIGTPNPCPGPDAAPQQTYDASDYFESCDTGFSIPKDLPNTGAETTYSLAAIGHGTSISNRGLYTPPPFTGQVQETGTSITSPDLPTSYLNGMGDLILGRSVGQRAPMLGKGYTTGFNDFPVVELQDGS